MLVLLLGTLSHVLNILLLVEGHLKCAAISIHALQNLPILHTGLEEGRVEGETYLLFYSLMFDKRVNAAFLELCQTASM